MSVGDDDDVDVDVDDDVITIVLLGSGVVGIGDDWTGTVTMMQLALDMIVIWNVDE